SRRGGSSPARLQRRGSRPRRVARPLAGPPRPKPARGRPAPHAGRTTTGPRPPPAGSQPATTTPGAGRPRPLPSWHRPGRPRARPRGVSQPREEVWLVALVVDRPLGALGQPVELLGPPGVAALATGEEGSV